MCPYISFVGLGISSGNGEVALPFGSAVYVGLGFSVSCMLMSECEVLRLYILYFYRLPTIMYNLGES